MIRHRINRWVKRQQTIWWWCDKLQIIQSISIKFNNMQERTNQKMLWVVAQLLPSTNLNNNRRRKTTCQAWIGCSSTWKSLTTSPIPTQFSSTCEPRSRSAPKNRGKIVWPNLQRSLSRTKTVSWAVVTIVPHITRSICNNVQTTLRMRQAVRVIMNHAWEATK